MQQDLFSQFDMFSEPAPEKAASEKIEIVAPLATEPKPVVVLENTSPLALDGDKDQEKPDLKNDAVTESAEADKPLLPCISVFLENDELDEFTDTVTVEDVELEPIFIDIGEKFEKPSNISPANILSTLSNGDLKSLKTSPKDGYALYQKSLSGDSESTLKFGYMALKGSYHLDEKDFDSKKEAKEKTIDEAIRLLTENSKNDHRLAFEFAEMLFCGIMEDGAFGKKTLIPNYNLSLSLFDSIKHVEASESELALIFQRIGQIKKLLIRADRGVVSDAYTMQDAIDCWKIAVTLNGKGKALAASEIGEYLYYSRSYDNAIEYLEIASNFIPSSAYTLASCYARGRGVTKNEKMSVSLYKQGDSLFDKMKKPDFWHMVV